MPSSLSLQLDVLSRQLSAYRRLSAEEYAGTEELLLRQEELRRLLSPLEAQHGSSAEEEARLCALLLETRAELLYSTPESRFRLQTLLERARKLLAHLPSAARPEEPRLRAALALHAGEVII